MTAGYRYQSDFAPAVRGVAQGREEARQQGQVEQTARSVVSILKARGFSVLPEVEARIAACGDLDQLLRWVVRAVDTDTVEGLFD
ncbi:hypothetical protein [Nocardia mexicana]|uniref:hypothetical protein n=1 Tax=Nocardia mexicana TaxID=279262 RepID=UPI0011C05322|nr:hypothetical protein [Nocardia mexicana]